MSSSITAPSNSSSLTALKTRLEKGTYKESWKLTQDIANSLSLEEITKLKTLFQSKVFATNVLESAEKLSGIAFEKQLTQLRTVQTGFSAQKKLADETEKSVFVNLKFMVEHLNDLKANEANFSASLVSLNAIVNKIEPSTTNIQKIVSEAREEKGNS